MENTQDTTDKETDMKNIVCADLHFTGKVPLMRKQTREEWVELQLMYLRQVLAEAEKRNAGVIIAGDIFDTPMVDMDLLNKVTEALLAAKEKGIQVYAIAGNHDLPYHSYENRLKSCYGNLEKNCLRSNSKDLVLFQFGTERPSDSHNEVVVLHHFSVRNASDLHFGMSGYTAEEIAGMYPETDFVVIGDNHTPWSVSLVGGPHIINCGCLIQEKPSDLGHGAGYWIIETDKDPEYVDLSSLGSETIDLGYLQNNISKKEKEKSLSEVVKVLGEMKYNKGKREVQKYDFLDMLNSYIQENPLEEGVREFLEELSEEVKKLLE